MNEIVLTSASLKRLEAAYQEAVKQCASEFVWEGHELVTGYAKYLIEYAHMKLG